MPLTSRQRIIRTFQHEDIDKVPCCFDCSQSDTIETLTSAFGFNTYEDLLRDFEVDLRWCVSWQDMTPINRSDRKGSYIDSWGVERSIFGGYPLVEPLKKATTIDELISYPNWPDPDDMDYRGLVSQMERFPEYAVLGGFWSPVMETASSLMGAESFYIQMALDEEFTSFLLDKVLDFYLECNRRLFELAGSRMQIFHTGDDYGSQNGLLFSPDMFRTYVKPRQKKLFDLGNQYGYFRMHHSCGGYEPVMPELIEMGVSGIQPIQVTASGMNPTSLAKKYGKNLVFMGGVDAQKTLPFGSTDEVREEVENRLKEFNGSSYILSTSQGILPETPPENIMEMYKTLKQWNKDNFN